MGYKIHISLLVAFLCYTSAASIPRDDYGRIKRSAAVVRQFKQQTGYNGGRTGYEIDHITPLHRGGCDSVENLQWLTIEEHQEKTRRER
ncbi:HNH endonuclease signature motif containing protein [Geobacter sp. SVR]|uniref:HNH endonuclease signature motif containing protein n=1 Tax=Geobacter sp. SVR TaxID=2495594 RepID=UPI00143F0039|nr:HNH endonuclease signature motif containing protein [Geobacter sp. SVR]BCS54741.1 hypothetical protein GSVR_30490 [Geobacter sp. SVR]GCF86451.1 hypothetical protein GSbR_30510 [Geobacter sp. SVR]